MAHGDHYRSKLGVVTDVITYVTRSVNGILKLQPLPKCASGTINDLCCPLATRLSDHLPSICM